MSKEHEKHEAGLRQVIQDRRLQQPGSVNDRMAPEFVSCSENGRECTVRYFLKPEMRNPMGWLHGGMTSAMLDMGMGLLTYYHVQMTCPTSSMTINFLRPNRIGGYLVVQSRVSHLGKKIVHLTSQAWMEDEPEHLTATATGSYVVLGKRKKEKLENSVSVNL
ncbi:MAG: PaaI family thioesterase [Eubacteriales bacterium]|nr:PaaI family thioesterase [Eubacteriales bacterium]